MKTALALWLILQAPAAPAPEAGSDAQDPQGTEEVSRSAPPVRDVFAPRRCPVFGPGPNWEEWPDELRARAERDETVEVELLSLPARFPTVQLGYRLGPRLEVEPLLWPKRIAYESVEVQPFWMRSHCPGSDPD